MSWILTKIKKWLGIVSPSKSAVGYWDLNRQYIEDDMRETIQFVRENISPLNKKEEKED